MRIKLHNARLSFCDRLFTAKAFQEGGPKRFGANLLVEPQTLAAVKTDKGFSKEGNAVEVINAAITYVAKEKWPKQYNKKLPVMKRLDQVCLRDGDNKPDYDGYPGNHYISANSKTRPRVTDGAGDEIAEEDGIVYSGCYVVAIIDIYAMDTHKDQVNASLVGVRFYKDGPAFSGAAPLSDDDLEPIGNPDDEASAMLDLGKPDDDDGDEASLLGLD